MHAEPPNVHVTVSFDYIQRVCREFFVAAFIHREVSVGSEYTQGICGQKVAAAGLQQSVDELARHNAPLASDTTSGIDQDGFAHNVDLESGEETKRAGSV